MPRSEVGRLHVIAGPMFAGKTEELLRRVGRARLAGLRVEVVSHAIDTRGGHSQLRTHTGRSASARMMSHPSELLELLELVDGADEGAPDIIAIDEAQFFAAGLVPVIERLLQAGIQVEVAGLCVTYDGDPFEPLPALMAVAEEVVKLTAVCSLCGADAAFHVRVHGGAAGDARRLLADNIGGTETYQARCRAHHDRFKSR